MRLNTNQFNWHSDIRVFTQEISSLQLGMRPPRSFELVSAKTGTVVVMHRHLHTSGPEGDIWSWLYLAQTDLGDPNTNWCLEIFND